MAQHGRLLYIDVSISGLVWKASISWSQLFINAITTLVLKSGLQKFWFPQTGCIWELMSSLENALMGCSVIATGRRDDKWDLWNGSQDSLVLPNIQGKIKCFSVDVAWSDAWSPIILWLKMKWEPQDAIFNLAPTFFILPFPCNSTCYLLDFMYFYNHCCEMG